jgi:hypothetical protein
MPLTVAVFIAAYVAIVAFSLPGATIATLTGGFLFATFPGALFNVTGATIGATLIFLAARWGLGERLAARMEAGRGAHPADQAGDRREPVGDAVPDPARARGAVLRGEPAARARGRAARALRRHHLPRDHPGRRSSTPRSARGWARSSPGARRRISGSSSSRTCCCRSSASRRCGAAHRAEGPARQEGALSMDDARSTPARRCR